MDARGRNARASAAAIYIFDPIDNRNYALDAERKVAVRIPRVPLAVPPMPPPLRPPASHPRPGPPMPPRPPAAP